MMLEKEDLGLSLSLNFPATGDMNGTCNTSSFQMNLLPLRFNLLPNWTHSFPSSSSSDRNDTGVFRADTTSFMKAIDVNRIPPSTDDAEEEAVVSSPNSAVSSISGKRSERDVAGEDLDGERASSRGISDEEDGDNGRKKLRLSKDQSAVLEESFKEHNTLNPKQKQALAKRLGLRPRQVEVWFQNRRARTKLKQTEVDCELMKRCCENLTEENRRLQKELQELRALKLSPQFYMHMTPPTTLTMCPSCEHVSAPPPSAATPKPADPSHRMLPFNPWATQGSHRPLNAIRPQP